MSHILRPLRPLRPLRSTSLLLGASALMVLALAQVGLGGSVEAGERLKAVGPVQVGGDVKAPVKVFAPAPKYTAEAREARLQGVTILQVIIDKNGEVAESKILKDLPMGLGEQAQEAIAEWRFEPATQNGLPVAVYYNLTVNFRLDPEKEHAEHAGSGPVHVGGNVQAPVKVYSPAPQYTDEARAAHLQGVVIMQAVIDRQGYVTRSKILKDLPMGLGEEAKKTISTWRFEPATVNGEPVDVYYNLTTNFRLDSQK